jgi:hypothetical protein
MHGAFSHRRKRERQVCLGIPRSIFLTAGCFRIGFYHGMEGSNAEENVRFWEHALLSLDSESRLWIQLAFWT